MTLRMRKKLFNSNSSICFVTIFSLYGMHIFVILFALYWFITTQDKPKSLAVQTVVTSLNSHEREQSNQINDNTPVLLYDGKQIVVASLKKIAELNLSYETEPLFTRQQVNTPQFFEYLKKIKSESLSEVLIVIAPDHISYHEVAGIISSLYGFSSTNGHYEKLFSKIVLGGEVI